MPVSVTGHSSTCCLGSRAERPSAASSEGANPRQRAVLRAAYLSAAVPAERWHCVSVSHTEHTVSMSPHCIVIAQAYLGLQTFGVFQRSCG